MTLPSHPNPDLSVGADNKQGWNQPHQRRHGFHNAHNIFRRTLMVRARRVFDLTDRPDAALASKAQALVIKVRAVVEIVDGWVEKVKAFLLKAVK